MTHSIESNPFDPSTHCLLFGLPIQRHIEACACVYRVFTEAKPRYQTEAEKRGYSWVFAGHVGSTASIFGQGALAHPFSEHWRAVRDATWRQVGIHSPGRQPSLK